MPNWTQMSEFVPKEMTTTERDADWNSPPANLIIFNTTIGMVQVYAGGRWVSLAHYVTVAATSSPGVGDDADDGYVIGVRWIDTTNDKEYVCVDVTVGAAVWLDLYHVEDHDHDGSPTQQLLAANTHESVATDTHHAQSHTLASHSAKAHGDLSDAPATAHHSALSVSGTPDYITLSGYDIIRAQIVLTTDVTGVLPEANLPNASDTAQGVVELATAAETTAGTDATRAVTPDGLEGSVFGTSSLAAGLPFFISGNGSVITTGIKGWIEVPFACTITAVRLLADVSGAIKIDIWKDTFANYPPTVADTITASAVPEIAASGVKDEDTTLTGWTTAVAKGDILYFNVDSVTSIKACLVSLSVDKT